VALATGIEAADAAEAALEQLDDMARTYDALVVEGKAAAAVVDESNERLAVLATEQAALAEAEEQLAALRPQSEGIDAFDALATAQAAIDALPVGDEPIPPDPAPSAAATAAAEDADAATKAPATAQQAWSAWEHHAARRAEADAALATALAHPFFVALRPPADHNATKNEVVARRKAATEVAKLEARLER